MEVNFWVCKKKEKVEKQSQWLFNKEENKHEGGGSTLSTWWGGKSISMGRT